MTSVPRSPGRRRGATRAAALGVAAGLLAGCGPAADPGPVASAGAARPDGTASTGPADPGPPAPQVPVRDARVPPVTVPVDPPVRLEIPGLELSMPVDPAGVADDGSMEVPPDATHAGWYRFGPAPASATGTTLIAAHVDSRLTGIGPFAQLHRLRPGDAVEVATGAGGQHTYVVVDVLRVAKESAPVGTWFDRDGPPRLVLVTCGGAWRADIGHYADNVVVTAEPVGG